MTTVYSVPGMTCQHCVDALNAEVGRVPGVEAVEIDLDAKTVTARGETIDDAAVRAAIDEAGYEVGTA